MRKLLVAMCCALACCLSLTAAGAELRAVIGLRLAPYVLEDQAGGLEYDYVALILDRLGYQAKPVFVPFKDTIPTLRRGDADMAFAVTHAIAPGLFLSAPYVAYRNEAIVLASSPIQLHAVGDLTPYSIAAFDRATDLLGPDFAKVARKSPSYSEYGNQLMQNLLLYQGKVDVAVTDVNIFHYLDGLIPQTHGATVLPVREYRLFPPSAYCVAFKDARLRDRFNTVLLHAHQLPGYPALRQRWQGRVGQPVDEILLEGRMAPDQ